MNTKQNIVIKSDQEIRNEVLDYLYRDYNVDASHIDVSVSDRVVTLKGYVFHPEEIKEAQRVVSSISFVKRVINLLEVARSKDRPLSQTGFETGFS